MKLFPQENLPQVQKLAAQLLLCACRVMKVDPIGEVTFESTSQMTKSGQVGYIVKARIRTILRHPETGEIYRCDDLELNVSTSSIHVYSYDSRDAERYCNDSRTAHAQNMWFSHHPLPDDTIAAASKLMKSEMKA